MRHEAHFTILANEAIRDGRLSGLARSVLMELISRPPGWQTNADQMWRQARKDRGDRAEGRRAFRAAFAELEEFGYLTRELKHNGKRVETVMHLFHLPQEGSGKASGNPSGNGSSNGVTGQGDEQGSSDDSDAESGDTWGTGSGTSHSGTSQSGTSETGTSLRRTEDGSTDVRSTEEEESSELADARSGSIASDRAREIEQQRQEHQKRLRAELERRWTLVDRLTPQQLREALYQFEKKRPRIYRECRQLSIRQFAQDDLKERAVDVDRLSYKYALQHYAQAVVPMCIARPIGIAA
ncbi:hypothetical protein ABZ249_29895 [Nocardiopsis sp. NPDC006139]|uniref:hypothetical protein n=1 Tax=Nocardiopsis sp. NPDC006139 TaxID=3154578 RepID=UPI0033A7CAD0